MTSDSESDEMADKRKQDRRQLERRSRSRRGDSISGGRYRLFGGSESPYSMKMRAIMRYRQLRFNWVQITPDIRRTLDRDGPPVIPILQLPEDASLHVDSTPLAYMLEELHGGRSLLPDDLQSPTLQN
jgi:hypothetical protein